MIDIAFTLQSLGENFTNLARNIRVVDILDVTIITFFLYVVLNWLRQSGSRRSLLNIFILVLIYVLARTTGMYLTERLIEGLFLIILVGLVVVFQSDMRRIVDRLSNWSLFNESVTNPTSDIVTSIITEAAAKMAESRTGALIVIKGKENWDRHVHGGIDLDGQITIPLLHSIFNTKAPGHDGAILLEGRRIKKFGVHLPLSTNLYKMSRGGTRHTAALGLCEQCDALVVVVSEERGSISIAKDGKIKELNSNSDLKKHLDEFWTEHYQGQGTTITHWWRRRSLRTALAATVLSIALWLTFASQSGTVYRTYDVPIEYRNLQSSKISRQDSLLTEARLTLAGPEQAFRTLDPSALVISFDLGSNDFNNNEMEISEENINLPIDLSLFEASPSELQIKTRSFANKELPVKIPTIGRLREGLQLVSVTPVPARINVFADTAAAGIDSIATDAVDLSTIQNTSVIQKRLQLNGSNIQLPKKTSSLIRVEITVEKTSE